MRVVSSQTLGFIPHVGPCKLSTPVRTVILIKLHDSDSGIATSLDPSGESLGKGILCLARSFAFMI